MNWNIVLSAVVGAVLGGGSITALIVLAFREKLRATFATIVDLNALGRKVDTLEGAFHATAAIANTTTGEVRELRQEQRHQWERLIKPVEELAGEMKEMRREFNEAQLEQARHNERVATELKHTTKKPLP